MRDAFASSWHSGASLRWNVLETAIEQLDWDERAQIEQAAAKIVGSFVVADWIVFFFPHLLRLESFRPSCRLYP